MRIHCGRYPEMEIATLFGEPRQLQFEDIDFKQIYWLMKETGAKDYQVDIRNDIIYIIHPDPQIEEKIRVRYDGDVLESLSYVRFRTKEVCMEE